MTTRVLSCLCLAVALAAAVAPSTAAKRDGLLPPGLAKKDGGLLPPGLAEKVDLPAVQETVGGLRSKAAKALKPKKAPAATPSPPSRSAAPAPPATSPAEPSSVSAAEAPSAETPAPVVVAEGGGATQRPAGRTGRANGDRRPRRPGRARRSTGAPVAAGVAATAATGQPPSGGRDDGRDRPPRRREDAESPSIVTRTVSDIVEIVPGWMKVAVGALGALALLLGAGYLATAMRARSLARQRGELLNEVGLLQSALLPAVPERVDALRTSVAYRPADGPGAGGDFYDVLELDGGRAGFVLGDVSGHGRDALERTAFMRYTLRAYLEAGLEPRVALQVAERAIGERLGSDFATVLLAVHDPLTASLSYATAGHPAPIVVGGHAPFRAVMAGASPPIGVGHRTGLRQTSVPLMPGTVVCVYTDGLVEARTADGLLGSERLEQLVAELGPDAPASALLERVTAEATAVPDDMATCLIAPTAGVTTGGFRTELLDLSADEAAGDLPRRFLEECGVAAEELDAFEAEIRETAELYGGAIVSIAFGARLAVRVLPRNVASIESAAWRAASAAAG